jgi:hypothetical protein
VIQPHVCCESSGVVSPESMLPSEGRKMNFHGITRVVGLRQLSCIWRESGLLEN